MSSNCKILDLDVKCDTLVPYYDMGISCGLPSEMGDIPPEMVLVPDMLTMGLDMSFARAQGDSMIGVGIHDGDLLVVDRSLRPASGDVIIACVDGDFTVKTLRVGKKGNGEWGMGNGGEVRLVAANPDYSDIVLKPGQELDYFGKVTACIHQFKKGK